MARRNRGKRWLLATARALSEELHASTSGTSIRVRKPSRAPTTQTDGWAATVGDLGNGRPRLEVWLDRYTGHADRKFWFGFYSRRQEEIVRITRRVNRELLPVRTITWEEVEWQRRAWMLRKRLSRDEFDQPILEKYGKFGAFFGMFEPAAAVADAPLIAHAAAFFESVARTLPTARPEDETREVYPQIENRLLVVSHLHRERSRILSAERKRQL